jgi:hypothetical protein
VIHRRRERALVAAFASALRGDLCRNLFGYLSDK